MLTFNFSDLKAVPGWAEYFNKNFLPQSWQLYNSVETAGAQKPDNIYTQEDREDPIAIGR